MKSLQFFGSVVALVTPFQKDGSIDEKTLRKLVKWHIENGTNGIVPCGTTGESATLSHEEHHRVIDIVIDEAKGKIPVIAGAGSNATKEAASLTEHAKKAGADAVLSLSPYYNKPTQQGIIEHYKKINEIGIPVVVYNVPGRTGSNITAETTLRLAEMENIIGIKEASGNMEQIMEILASRPKGFKVFSGDDSLAYPLMTLGADGCISVVANEIPKKFSEMLRYLKEGNLEKAKEIHNKYLKLMRQNFIETNPIPVKTALSLMGKIEENFRLPLVPISTKNKEILKETLHSLSLM